MAGSSSTLYDMLADLIAFLNLPVCVYGWLPPKKLEAITLCNSWVMDLSSYCTAVDAVELMLGFPIFYAASKMCCC